MERYVIGQDFNTKDWFVYDNETNQNVCVCDTEEEAKMVVYKLLNQLLPTFEQFMKMFDDWNGMTVVNDDNLDCIVKDKTSVIMEKRKDLYEKEVVSFGFYDGEFCVRVK